MDPTTLIYAAVDNGAPAGTVTAQLRDLGYTAAQISTLFNQVAATNVGTPDIIAYLKSENARLQSAQQMNNWLWMGGLFLGGWYLLSRNNRR